MGPITPYNDILRLDELGLNHSEIERSLNGLSTRKTIISVLKRSAECGLHYPLDPPLSDLEIHRLLHPKKDKNIRMPNLEKTIFQINLPGQSIADVWREYKSKNEFAYGKTTFQNLINDNISQYQTDTYESNVYDIAEINRVLEEYHLPRLFRD